MGLVCSITIVVPGQLFQVFFLILYDVLDVYLSDGEVIDSLRALGFLLL